MCVVALWLLIGILAWPWEFMSSCRIPVAENNFVGLSNILEDIGNAQGNSSYFSDLRRSCCCPTPACGDLPFAVGYAVDYNVSHFSVRSKMRPTARKKQNAHQAEGRATAYPPLSCDRINCVGEICV